MTNSSSVCFAPMVKSYTYIHIYEFSEEERRACWYSRDELKAIKLDMSATVLAAMGWNPVDRDNVCTRGLEHLTPESSAQRKLIRSNARTAVMEEQSSQRAKDIYSPSQIAKVYAMKSERSQALSVLMARADRKIVVRMNWNEWKFSTKKGPFASSAMDMPIGSNPRRRRIVSSRAA